MLRNGEHAKLVQEMLDHSTIAIMIAVNSCVLQNIRQDVVERFGTLLL